MEPEVEAKPSYMHSGARPEQGQEPGAYYSQEPRYHTA